MADLTAEIDRLTREHAERCGVCCGALPADDPDACSACGKTWPGRSGSIYPAQVEREARSPGLGELRAVAERLAADPAPDRSAFDRDAAALRGDWGRVGHLWIQAPSVDAGSFEAGDMVMTLPPKPPATTEPHVHVDVRLPWWRRIWRQRG